MTVLVIGGSGYLGSSIVRTLADSGMETIALSRSATGPGKTMRGDVTAHRLGLERGTWHKITGSATHIVSCFGSVDWSLGPSEAIELHGRGTEAVVQLARECHRLERLVHVSSVLVHGRAKGPVGNRELYTGQDFRNWYEYGKYLAERTIRDAADVPWTVVRVGPLLGEDPHGQLSMRHGLLSALPTLLRGYPVHLSAQGKFPCYIGEVDAAARVMASATTTGEHHATWTWFDPATPTLADTLWDLCSAWNIVPRIVESRLMDRCQRALATRMGVPNELLDYASPWFDLPAAVLDDLPDVPECSPGYVRRSGAALNAGHAS